MRLLLDSHVAIWAVTDSKKLSTEARALIGSHDNEKLVSVATIWEIAIKRARRPQSIPIGAETAIQLFTASGYTILPINAEHAAVVESLPPLHGDPFDRLLVAQALHEPMHLMTHDKKVAAYSDSFLLV